MNWTQDRAELNADGDFFFQASNELVTGICLVGHFVEELTGNDLCNWQTRLQFANDVFVLRADDHDDLPNFSFGTPGSEEAFDVAWYKEAGRCTTVSREVNADEVVAAVAACLASLLLEVPE